MTLGAIHVFQVPESGWLLPLLLDSRCPFVELWNVDGLVCSLDPRPAPWSRPIVVQTARRLPPEGPSRNCGDHLSRAR